MKFSGGLVDPSSPDKERFAVTDQFMQSGLSVNLPRNWELNRTKQKKFRKPEQQIKLSCFLVLTLFLLEMFIVILIPL